VEAYLEYARFVLCVSDNLQIQDKNLENSSKFFAKIGASDTLDFGTLSSDLATYQSKIEENINLNNKFRNCYTAQDPDQPSLNTLQNINLFYQGFYEGLSLMRQGVSENDTGKIVAARDRLSEARTYEGSLNGLKTILQTQFAHLSDRGDQKLLDFERGYADWGNREKEVKGRYVL
jgi:hypothetical protein